MFKSHTSWVKYITKYFILFGAIIDHFGSVQLLSLVQLFETPWTAARQASLSITNSWSLLKLMSIELVMPSNHPILCHPLLLLPSIFPSIGSFVRSQFFTTGGQSIGASASASVLPKNIQDGFPLELTYMWIFFSNKFILQYSIIWGWVNPPLWSHRYQWLTVKLYVDLRLHKVSTPHPSIAQRSATLVLYYSYNRS